MFVALLYGIEYPARIGGRSGRKDNCNGNVTPMDNAKIKMLCHYFSILILGAFLAQQIL
jgi:hypothetical protein